MPHKKLSKNIYLQNYIWSEILEMDSLLAHYSHNLKQVCAQLCGCINSGSINNYNF